MGAPRIRPAIVEYFHDHAGRSVSVAQLTKATGLTADQVRPVVRSLIRSGTPITVVAAGQVWRFDDDKPTATVTALKPKPSVAETPDTLFEAVGSNAKGEIIVRGDVTGSLFKVVRL